MTTQPAFAPSASFELDRPGDDRIARAATWARQLGLVNGVYAAFALVGGSIVATCFFVFTAILLLRAANSLRAIVRTSGHDVAHLTNALDRIAGMFWYRIMLLVGLVGFTLWGALT